MKKGEVKLLWTGGWDSTFRLCQLLVIDKVKVRPFYILDVNRQSLREELKAQEEIKSCLFSKFPFTKNLLCETEYCSLSGVEKDPEIEKTYKEVYKIVQFGSQYEWLANFCNTKGISNLELGFERDPNSKKNKLLSQDYIVPFTNEMGLSTFRINPELKGDPIFELFKYYEWPIWMVTRKDMIPIAKEHGFYDIMHQTWFCHTPINGKPCGLCNPCKDAVFYNFKYRLSMRARTRYHLRFLSRRELSKVKDKIL